MSGRTVGIVGAGAVGQTVGALLVIAPWCDGVTVVSRTRAAAAGLACDLEDMAAVTGSPMRVTHTLRPGELAGCDALVLCPRAHFTNTALSDVRMSGLSANAPVIARLARQLEGYRGVVIVVTNPVDILTRLFAEVAGTCRVYGVGSHTDTARYRLAVARWSRLPVEAVHAHVIGEHGDAAVPCATTLNGQALDAVPVQVVAEAKGRPSLISTGIGRTRCGPAGAVLAALTHTLGLTDGVIELSTRHPGGAWCGLPVRFTAGHPSVVLPRLTPDQDTALAATAAKVSAAYGAIAPHLIPRKETLA